MSENCMGTLYLKTMRGHSSTIFLHCIDTLSPHNNEDIGLHTTVVYALLLNLAQLTKTSLVLEPLSIHAPLVNILISIMVILVLVYLK